MKISRRTTPRLYKTLLMVSVLMLIGLTERTVAADPLLFSNLSAFQNNDTTLVDLFSNPGTTLVGPNLTFSINVLGTLGMGAVDTLMITYLELGSSPIVQTFQIPLFGSVDPPFTLLFSILSPGANSQGVPAILTVDLLNSAPDFIIPSGPNQGQLVNSYTFTFNVVQPVPEPATFLALLSGVTALGLRLRRRN